jgi:hypothetical protein
MHTMSRKKARQKPPVLRLFTRLERAERDWAHQHHDGLSRRAERAMNEWKMTLTQSVRASIGETARRERVQKEMTLEKKRPRADSRAVEEASRRTVHMTVATGTNCGTTGLDYTASADRKAEAQSTAGLSPVASSRQPDGRDRPALRNQQPSNIAVTSGNMTASAPGSAASAATTSGP